MAFDLTKNERDYFFYQIGSVQTVNPWKRPNYNKLRIFFTREEHEKILSKYKVSIIGKCLWDFNSTWDLDLCLQPKNSYEIVEYEQIEKDINDLNLSALNYWSLLLDICYLEKEEPHILPSKKQILEAIYDSYTFDEVQHPTDYLKGIIKIGYCRKVIGEVDSEINLIDLYPDEVEKLTEGHLVRVKKPYHDKKIVNMILNSTAEDIKSSLSVEEFLLMSEEEFLKYQNR